MKDSDGTVIIFRGEPRGGTKQTREFCENEKASVSIDRCREDSEAEASELIVKFVRENRIQVLNVAGPRASEWAEGLLRLSCARSFPDVAAVSDRRTNRGKVALIGEKVCDGRRPPLQKMTVERLRRLEQVFDRVPIYFVTTCTSERRAVLACDAVHDALKCFAASGPDQGGWIGAYVLMPDHLHLFVALDETQTNLSKWMKALKAALSAALRANGHSPPYWQKGFFDHVLRSDESYSAKWDYVRDNPVRAARVSEPSEWPYLGQIFDLDYRRDRV